MVEKARKIVMQVDALLVSTRKRRGPLTGPLSLGVIPSLAPYLLPRLLPLIKSHYDRLHLVIHEDLTAHLMERLRGYQIDAALLALPLDGEDFEEIPLFDEPFWFACPPRHPLAHWKPSPRRICAMSLCCCWPMDTVCGVRRWRPAGARLRTRRGSTIFVPRVWRRFVNWSPQGLVAHCYPPSRRARRRALSRHLSPYRCNLVMPAAALAWCGAEIFRKHKNLGCSPG